MFSLSKMNKSLFPKMLMSFALISYLVLSLAGIVLHNHPHKFLPFIKCNNCYYYDCHDCDNHQKQSNHAESNCPVCHFNVVIAGGIPVTEIIIMITMLWLCLIVFMHNPLPSFQNYYRISLRAPPYLFC